VSVDQAPAASVSERAEAIEQSGRGARFRLVQWRNAAFWVFVFGMVAGTVQLLHLYGPQLGSYGVGIGSGVLLFGIYLIPWLFLLGHHNRHTALPPTLLLVAFLWGAVPATYLMGLPANTAILALYGKLFGSGWAHDFGAGFTAPFTEETAKASALVLLLGLAPRLIRSPYDGLIVGAFAGLGLQISEDVLYSFNAAVAANGVDQVDAAWTLFLARAGAGIVSHTLFSAVFCSGLLWILGRGVPRHPVRGALMILAAMAAHSVWDNAGAYAGAWSPVLMLLTAAAELVLLWYTFRLAAPPERAWTRAILAPEVEHGVLHPAELDAVTGNRRAFLRSLRGPGQKKAGRHMIAAAHDLTRALARAGGTDSPEVQHARAEVARIRAVG
jgi:RsiW-degrading membrane proteinase PrsW (M82 family)